VATDSFSIDWIRFQFEVIRVPTIQPHPKNINESDKQEREPGTSSPSVANSTLVAITTTTQLTVNQPVLLPVSPPLLEDPSNAKAIHPMHPRLQLAVWTISNNSAQKQAFRTQLHIFCPQLHVSPPTKYMIIVHGQNGIACVIERKLIQF
jgi:hypothetical protein